MFRSSCGVGEFVSTPEVLLLEDVVFHITTPVFLSTLALLIFNVCAISAFFLLSNLYMFRFRPAVR